MPRIRQNRAQAAGQPQAGVRVARQAPGQRRAQVVVLGLQPRQPAPLLGADAAAGSARSASARH